MLDKLTVDDFKPAVGQAFVLDAGDAGQLELALVEVRALGAETTPNSGQRAPFALGFRGPADPTLPQATYRLQHDELGALEIFIVPIGRTEAGTDYEAIFT